MIGHATTNSHGQTAGYADDATHLDVLIVGAGISGINAAYRVKTELPDASFAVIDTRHELGGTWSQFKYPGVRSDSDLHTLGFKFNPWEARNPIATGDSILQYLQDTADKFDLTKRLRFNHKVVSADWSGDQQRWKVEVDVRKDEDTRREVIWAKFIILGTGYYSYEKPMFAHIPGLAENFKGQTIHPQFWPEDLDFKDKKVVVIGSGATAITLLPALVDGGVGQVTQLQRSPSYVLGLPQPGNDSTPPLWERMLPHWMVLKWKRKCAPALNLRLTDTQLKVSNSPSFLSSSTTSASTSRTKRPTSYAAKPRASFPPTSPWTLTSSLVTTPGSSVYVSAQTVTSSSAWVAGVPTLSPILSRKL
jgi:cation diffusion facilitator CzcD-associated flavoprotein CzcO